MRFWAWEVWIWTTRSLRPLLTVRRSSLVIMSKWYLPPRWSSLALFRALRPEWTLTKKITNTYWDRGLPRWHSGKESACQCRRFKRLGFDPWIEKIPWRGAWQPTPVFWPGKFPDRGGWWATVHGVTNSSTWLRSWAHTQMHWAHSYLPGTAQRPSCISYGILASTLWGERW